MLKISIRSSSSKELYWFLTVFESRLIIHKLLSWLACLAFNSGIHLLWDKGWHHLPKGLLGFDEELL